MQATSGYCGKMQRRRSSAEGIYRNERGIEYIMHVANEHDWIGNRRGGGWLGERGRDKRKEASVLGVFM